MNNKTVIENSIEAKISSGMILSEIDFNSSSEKNSIEMKVHELAMLILLWRGKLGIPIPTPGGQIVEQGTYEMLVGQKGHFSSMIQLQELEMSSNVNV